jgi:hypothetical protein
MTEPRDLSDLVPNHLRADLAVAVAVLEQYGPAVRQALQPLELTEDEWRLVEHATGIDRGWDAAHRLVSTLDPPGQGRPPA